jgi:competence protein ComEC
MSEVARTGDINDASYVIIYRSSAGRVIFPGDSNDKTWEYILENHKDLVSDAAVLFAPHHGRKSGREYSFLDVVKPRVSFFGCAPSEDLAYSAWRNRDLLYFTNNQCGNIHLYPVAEKVEVFIENSKYANDYTGKSTYQKDGLWFLCTV